MASLEQIRRGSRLSLVLGVPKPTGTVTFTLYDNVTCNGNVRAAGDDDLVRPGNPPDACCWYVLTVKVTVSATR